jgi:Na+/phosphate symporter
MTFWERTFLGAGLAFIGFLFVGIMQVSAQTIPIPTPQEVTDFTNQTNPTNLVVIALVLVVVLSTIADYRIRMRAFDAQDKDRALASRGLDIQASIVGALTAETKELSEVRKALEVQTQTARQVIETVLPAMASEKQEATIARREREEIYASYSAAYDTLASRVDKLNGYFATALPMLTKMIEGKSESIPVTVEFKDEDNGV